MNVQQYWEKRNTEREAYWLNVSEETFEKDLERLYARSLQHMKTQINAFYGRFASQNGLSIQEATKLLTGSEYRVWRMDIEDYVNKIKAGEEGLKKELNTLAMRSRISRVEKLYSETLMQLDELGRSTSSGMKKLLTDAYEDNYYHQAYDLGKAGIKLPTKMLDESGVEEVLMTPWSGKNYSQRIWKNQRKLANTLKDTIFNGVHRGVSVEKMTADVMARMDVSHSDAIRLVRTELNYVTNKGNLNSLNEAGMKHYRFVATLDSRTSATCRAHDGKVYPVTDGVQGYNVPPLHPHCRSIIVGELKGYDRSNNTREARVGGKTIDVPSTMTYEDFKAVYVDGTKKLNEVVKTAANFGTIKLKKVQSDVSDEEYNEILDTLNQSENDDLKGLYANYADNITHITKRRNGGSYSSRRDTIEWDTATYDGLHKYSTLFHEYGHYFDYKVPFKDLDFSEVDAINSIPHFKFLERKASFSKKFMDAVRADKEHLTKVLTKEAKADMIKNNASAGVQDAIDGLFEKSRIRWGHGEKYYNRKYSLLKGFGYHKELQKTLKGFGYDVSTLKKTQLLMRQYETASEIWANVSSAIATNSTELGYIKKYLPNSYKAYVEMIKGVE